MSCTYQNRRIAEGLSNLKNYIDDDVIGVDLSGNESGNEIIVDVLSRLVKAKLRCVDLNNNDINNLIDISCNKIKTISETNQKSGTEYNLLAKSMRILNMAYNKLTTTTGIGNMQTLDALDLSNNRITGFPKINNMTSMIVLNLSSNKIRNIDEVGINIKKHEHQITILELSNNHITDISPLFNKLENTPNTKEDQSNCISCIENLKLLNVSNNILLSLPDNMQDYTPKLVVANLAYNQLKDKDVKNILNIQTLEVLILRANKRITLDAFYGIDKVLRTIDNAIGINSDFTESDYYINKLITHEKLRILDLRDTGVRLNKDSDEHKQFIRNILRMNSIEKVGFDEDQSVYENGKELNNESINGWKEALKDEYINGWKEALKSEYEKELQNELQKIQDKYKQDKEMLQSEYDEKIESVKSKYIR